MMDRLIVFCLLAAFGLGSAFTGGDPMPNQQIRVVYFLSPSCRICQYYTLTMRELYTEYGNRGVHFEGSVPGPQFDSIEVARFCDRYRIPFRVSSDTILHRELHATVTPEVFVMDELGKILYHGRIDDSYAAIGKRRPRTGTHELSDALDRLLAGDTLVVKHVPAVGCIIEK